MYTVIAHVSPVMDKHGNLIGFLGIEEDITNIEQLAEDRRTKAQEAQALAHKFEEANRRLSIEDRAKNEFIATLAHELRNPLAPVVSSLELIKMRAVELNHLDLLQLAETAETHNRTLVRLLDDLLDITRITRKKFKLQKESVELHAVVGRAVQAVNAAHQSQQHALGVMMPEGNLWISADPLRFEQILINLLGNAAKYTDPGGHIELRVAHDPERGLRISVKDNGMGIEPRMLKKIFEPFIQAHNGTSAGLGIGLSLTKRLTELHDGRIWAKSDGVGCGSEFVVVLPPQNAPLPFAPAKGQQRKGPPAPEKKSARNYSILIVDDNKAAADVLGTLLERDGHTVSIAYDGLAAIETMRKLKAEVVFLDIGLPNMDGYAVAQILRQEHGANLLLVALTGYGQDEDKTKARQAGFNHHLTKPVSTAEIEAILARDTSSLERGLQLFIP